jgi:protein tyrosine/serine phosphatase
MVTVWTPLVHTLAYEWILATKKWFLRRCAADLSDRIKRSRDTMTTPWQRALGHFESLFIDHAVFRLAYFNLYRVSDGLFRSSQPSPSHVRRLAQRGIRTIVNLRGERKCASYILEAEACRRHKVKLVNFPVRSRDVPSKETLHAARQLFQTIEYPALIHCKSGADRAGFMAALYLFIHENQPVEQAVSQLSWKYGHFRHAKTGILDHFFDRYRTSDQRHGMTFFEWVEKVYCPDDVKRSFRSHRWASAVVDRMLARE